MERDVEFDVIPKEDTLTLVKAIEEPVEKVESETTSKEDTEDNKQSEESKNEDVKEDSSEQKTSNKTIFIGIGSVIVIAIIALVVRKIKK